jgi:hypothetical protein
MMGLTSCKNDIADSVCDNTCGRLDGPGSVSSAASGLHPQECTCFPAQPGAHLTGQITHTSAVPCWASVSCANDNFLPGGRIMALTTVKSTYCWICGKEVSLADCKTDEWGRAVHSECHIARMKLESESKRASGLPVNSI